MALQALYGRQGQRQQHLCAAPQVFWHFPAATLLLCCLVVSLFLLFELCLCRASQHYGETFSSCLYLPVYASHGHGCVSCHVLSPHFSHSPMGRDRDCLLPPSLLTISPHSLPVVLLACKHHIPGMKKAPQCLAGVVTSPHTHTLCALRSLVVVSHHHGHSSASLVLCDKKQRPGQTGPTMPSHL